MEVNEWAFQVIPINGGKVDCPWWKRPIDIWDDDKGCLTVCEFGNGTAQGEGIECLWKATLGGSKEERAGSLKESGLGETQAKYARKSTPAPLTKSAHECYNKGGSELIGVLEGGLGSGHFGHAGRPGEVGGSTSRRISPPTNKWRWDVNPHYKPGYFAKQDGRLEEIPKIMADRSAGVLYEAAGDIFREFNKRMYDPGYIQEKVDRIRKNVLDLKHNQDRSLVDEWRDGFMEFAYDTDTMKAFRDLVNAMADRRLDAVENALLRIESDYAI